MIICDICKKYEVEHNGERCEKCIGKLSTDLAEDREGITGVYLPPDLMEKFLTLDGKIRQGDIKAEGLFGKMMGALKTAFINPLNGKTIINPVPDKICVTESSMDRIERFITKQASDIARKHEMETEESLNDWTIEDLRSPEFEQSIYQIVTNIEPMSDVELEPVEPPAGDQPGGQQDPPAAEPEA